MTEKFYEVYFEPSVLEVDEDGHLENEKALYILEYNENGKVLNRVNSDGKPIDFGDESLENILDLYHVGYGDDDLEEALQRFHEWLEQNTEWVCTSRQTYWQPAEYRCIGIIGYNGYEDEEDDDDMEWYRLHWKP